MRPFTSFHAKIATVISVTLAYQYCPTPPKTQEQLLGKLLGIAYHLYNDALKEREAAWENEKRTVTDYEQALKLMQLRKMEKERPSSTSPLPNMSCAALIKPSEGFSAASKKGAKWATLASKSHTAGFLPMPNFA